MLTRQVVFAVLVCSALTGQTPGGPAGAGNGNSPQGPSAQVAAPQQPAQAGDDLAQMRIDLERMDSLNGNMSSEIEFLHDQNLQILLRTNAQMWTILIRDLRNQIAREERRLTSQPSPGTLKPLPQSNPR